MFFTGIRLSVIRTNLAGQYPFSATTTYTAVAPTTSKAGSGLIASTNPFPQSGTVANRTISQWFNPACFAVPAAGTFGNSGRNIFEGPDSVVLNLAVGRVFAIPREIGSFELRLEGFNALNHPSFGYPTSVIGSSTTAGVISSTTGNQRLVQISGRYSF